MTKINEIEAAARYAKRAREAADAADAAAKAAPVEGSWPVVPIAIGIGSAALAAALLYANRPRKK